MAIAEALIGAGGSLLGGLFGKSKTISAGDNMYSHVGGVMQAAERFGFNPLTLLGVTPGMGQVVSPQNYMGQAIADSALLVADSIAAKKADQTAKKAQDLEAANAKLNSQIRDLTLRPKIGGVYAQRQSSPTLRQALGAEDETSGEATAGLPGDSDASRVPDDFVGGIPRVTLFGKTYEGSGAMSSGQTIEDALGDSLTAEFVMPAVGADMALYTWGKDLGVVKAPYGQKPGKPIPEVEVRKPFPRRGSEDAFNYQQGRHRPDPAWMRAYE
ncbi:MAG: hypothetical protein E6R08_06710 [Nevskiaceae bacterium]|nr:MAG: hypothetical protein E6R08_06710 [Nevskiaceae bacterium]